MQPIKHSLPGILDSLEKAIQEDHKKKAVKESAEIVQLKFWPEPVRGTPNPVLRGALFSGVQGRYAKYIERELIACQKGFQIRFTGKQLIQTDLDVWEQALHLTRMHPLGTRCEFTAYSFLKTLGRGTGKRQQEQLERELAHLMGCGLEVTDTYEQLTYGGSLLEFFRDEVTNRYVLEINPRMKALFDEGWVEIDVEQRRLLRNKPLAQWLHGYLATHQKPFNMKLGTYRELSGSSKKERPADFKKRLKKALNELLGIGYIRAFNIDEAGLVHIERTASAQFIHGPLNRPVRR